MQVGITLGIPGNSNLCKLGKIKNLEFLGISGNGLTNNWEIYLEFLRIPCNWTRTFKFKEPFKSLEFRGMSGNGFIQ